MSYEQMAEWFVKTYIAFGGSVHIGYQAAGLFVQAVMEARDGK